MKSLSRINMILAAVVLGLLVVVITRFRPDSPDRSDNRQTGMNAPTAAEEKPPTGFQSGPLARQTRQQAGGRETTERSPNQARQTRPSGTPLRSTVQQSPLNRAAVGFEVDADEGQSTGDEEPIELRDYSDLPAPRASRLTSG